MPKSDYPHVAPDDVRGVVASEATKSDKIRRLSALGLPRADIARALAVRYQFVRNVLEHDRQKAARLAASGAQADRVAEGAAVLSWPLSDKGVPDPVRVQIAHDGCIIVPRRLMAAVGLTPGGEALLCVDGDDLKIYSRETAIGRAQRLVSRHVPAGVSLVDELIADRRREAAHEVDDAGA